MSIEVDNLRITKLRDYLMDIIGTLDDKYKQINVNFLSNDVNNYSLDKIPIEKGANSWIIGDILQTEVYSFRSRMNYSTDTISNIKNIGFYEDFEKLIKLQDDYNILPDIKGIESIKCLNSGSMTNANTNTSEFDIQVQIQYREVLNETNS